MKKQIHIQREMTEGSKRALYGRLVVGKTGWGAMLKYELITWFSTYVPGALGLFLRENCIRCCWGVVEGDVYLATGWCCGIPTKFIWVRAP